MSTENVIADLEKRIQSGYPLLFLQTWEEDRWEQQLADLALELERGLVVWTASRGWRPPPTADEAVDPVPADVPLDMMRYPTDHVFLIKDFHPYLSDALVLRRLRDALPDLIAQRKCIVFLGPISTVPVELAKDSVRIELPLPAYEDLKNELGQVLAEAESTASGWESLSENDEDKLIKATMGLTTQEARKAWKRALTGRDEMSDDVLIEIIAEKRTLASGSELLEFYDLEEGVADVGGLDQLKDWLGRRSDAYGPRAKEQGIPLPKGVLLLGVQGCGKSLTARATARLLSFPLVRLDIANLLTGERGGTERNLRDVLQLCESIAPVVLWMDEMEKGFAGLDAGAGSDATMNRLVGSFLTWMTEIRKPVFVVATANSVDKLPPELLRRGRFDEMFFIDLPNYYERKQILEIHLHKRGWKPENFDLDAIAERTEGYSGAELEQVVTSALIEAFGDGRLVNDDDLERCRRLTVPLSITMEEKIFQLRQWAETRCRRATSDSRVTQMLEDEQRHGLAGGFNVPIPEKELATWAALAKHGQLKAAVTEFVRDNGETLFPTLQDVFAEFFETTGELGLASRLNPNTVLWSGMSQELCQIVTDLVASKRLYVHPVAVEEYQKLQKSLKLPVIHEPTDEKLARPSWLPSSVRTGPHPVHAARLSRIARMRLKLG
jgi:SpoVK/Ycf46/Vps4 family AAA+-type ATPase